MNTSDFDVNIQLQRRAQNRVNQDLLALAAYTEAQTWASEESAAIEAAQARLGEIATERGQKSEIKMQPAEGIARAEIRKLDAEAARLNAQIERAQVVIAELKKVTLPVIAWLK